MKLKDLRFETLDLRKLFILISICLTSHICSAQELNCQVNITTQLSGADAVRIFGTSMTTQVRDFMNNYRFTTDKFEQNERIDCAVTINVTTDNGSGNYQGTISITARRPIFKAGIYTPLLDFMDRSFTFSYVEQQPMDFTLQGFTTNLTSVLGYYAYVILALDYDSFSLLGGTDMWKKAQIIVNNAQSATEPGWVTDNVNPFRNRYAFVDNIMNPMFQPLRESFYTYHRKGMDAMYDKVEDGRAAIMLALDNIREVHKNRPASYNVQVFFEAKNMEIVNIFQKATAEEKTQVLTILSEIDPANTTIYSKITSP